jgi:hypothetical protein
MTTPSNPEDQTRPRDEANWAQQVSALRVSETPSGAVNLNVDGRQVVGPLQGFGPLWRKTYQVRLAGVEATPAAVVASWKENFDDFQPPQNHMYASRLGIVPGEVVLMNASMHGVPVDSGLMVLYADDESFSLMTPEGCPEAGWITCSAFAEGDCTVAQVQTFGRANDPIYEIGFRIAGATEQQKIWRHVLVSLARHFGVDGEVQMQKTCLDPRIQWSRIGNVVQNAGVHSIFYRIAHPAHLLRALRQR